MPGRKKATGVGQGEGQPGRVARTLRRIETNRRIRLSWESRDLVIRLLVAAVVLVCLGRVAASEPVAPDVTVATVNGEPITARELRQAMLRCRMPTLTTLELQNTDRANDRPVEQLRRPALEACVRRKVEWLLARDMGLAERDITYTRFLERLEEENLRREEALRRGEVIYGPTQYREDVYWIYLHDELVCRLKERLAQSEFAVDEDALRSLYRSQLERYQRPPRVKSKRIVVPFDKTSELYPSRSAARRLIEAARKRLSQGEPFEAVLEECSPDADFEAAWREESHDNDLSWMSQPLRQAALQLSPGQVSPVVEDGKAFYLLLCEEREAAGHYTFQEVRKDVLKRCVDKQYERRLDSLIEQAEIVVNQEVYHILRLD